MKLIDIFYGINSDIIKSLMIESINFINKMRESKDILDENETDHNLEDNNNLIKITKNYQNSIVMNKQSKKNKNRINTNNKIFMIFFGFDLLVLYFYFIYNWIYLIFIIKKTETIFEFGVMFQEYQSQKIEMFNAYREFLFDNETKIMNYYSLDYLKKLEIEIYDKTTELSANTDKFILNLVKSNYKLIEPLSVNYCFYKESGYFDSLEECNFKFGNIFKFHFHILFNYFLEEIKINKNIARIRFKSEKIKGNLNNFNKELFINELEKDKQIEFRFK
jgi:hypothetical protein